MKTLTCMMISRCRRIPISSQPLLGPQAAQTKSNSKNIFAVSVNFRPTAICTKRTVDCFPYTFATTASNNSPKSGHHQTPTDHLSHPPPSVNLRTQPRRTPKHQRRVTRFRSPQQDQAACHHHETDDGQAHPGDWGQ